MIKLEVAKISDIRISDFDLRNVNTDHPQYQQIVHSLKNGYPILNPINVKVNKNKTSESPEPFILIDGKHRLTAAKEVGLDTIPVNIINLDDSDLHFAQMIANMARVETRPVQYAKQLQRILAMPDCQNLTKEEILTKIGCKKSPIWFDNQLNLNNLMPEIQEMVDKGQINVSNAYVLAKLPADEQIHWIDRATANDPDFIVECNKRLADIKKISRGEKPVDDPLATAKSRKLSEIKDKFVDVEKQLTAKDLLPNQKEFLTGFYEGLRYCIKIDQETLDNKENEKKRRAAERELFVQKRKELMAEIAKQKDIKVTDEEIEQHLKSKEAAESTSN